MRIEIREPLVFLRDLRGKRGNFMIIVNKTRIKKDEAGDLLIDISSETATEHFVNVQVTRSPKKMKEGLKEDITLYIPLNTYEEVVLVCDTLHGTTLVGVKDASNSNNAQ